MLRELSRSEVSLVSGGTDDLPDPIIVDGRRIQYSLSTDDWLSLRQNATVDFTLDNFGSGGGGGSAPTHHPDGTDNDGDGINETPPIIVTATQAQVDAARYHYDVAWWSFYGLLSAATGGLGWAGRAGAAGGTGAAGTTLAGAAADEAINRAADLNYRRDAADGSVDGRIDPRYITGERTLPPLP